jgi:flagellar assembly factor FliW
VILENSRFGKVNYKKSDIVWMVRGLLGFDECKRYIIIALKGQEPFKWLQSLDDPNLAFLMIDPLFFKQDYVVEVNPKDIALLGANEPSEISIFVLVTITSGQPDKMSVNLQGPLIINKHNLHGAQLVLGESTYGTRHFIFKDLEKKMADCAV